MDTTRLTPLARQLTPVIICLWGTDTDADLETTAAPTEEPDRPAAVSRRFAPAQKIRSIAASARRFGRVRKVEPPAAITRLFNRVRKVESPVAATLLSYFVPGLGQLAMGRGRLAALFLVPTLIGLGWIGLQLNEGLAWFGLSLFDGGFVVTLTAILAFLAVWRILAVGHAFATAPGQRRWRRLERVMTAVLVVSIVAAHVAAIAGAWVVYETGAAIGSNDMLSDSSLAGGSPYPSPEASATPDVMTSMAPYVSSEPSSPSETNSSPEPTSSAKPTPTPTPLFRPYWVNPDRITFLLIGVDFMSGRSHALTDSLILATLDVHTNKATIISVPRDTANFPLYYGGKVSVSFKLNELMSAASSSSFGSPDSAVETLKKEIGFLVGLPVDYYAAADLEGFVKIVQAIGGVDVDVKTAVDDPFTGTFVPKGLIHMDGHLALKYARSRMSSSDYARSSRQQDVLIALAHKVVSPAIVPLLPTLLPLAWQTLATDFPMQYARNFVTAFRRVGTPTQCVLGPPYSYHPDLSATGGTWVTDLDIDRVAALSIYLFGRESTYLRPDLTPAPCAS